MIYLYYGNHDPYGEYDDLLAQRMPGMPGIPGMPGGNLPMPPWGGSTPPGGPPSGPPMGGQQPMGAPPSFVPQMMPSWRDGTRGIRHCMYRFTYIWLNNGNSFWFYPTFVGYGSLVGFRWRRNRWEYSVINLNRIRSYQCY